MMKLHIILVEPARAENVGAAARAMKTMGFHSLRMVNSEADLQPQAKWVAHGANDILENCVHFTSLEEALQDIDFTIATTARYRARYHYYCSPEELVTQLTEKQQWLQNIALVFGREDSGLTNEELGFADLLTGVPMANDYPSLNLGQSVMVYCYQLSNLFNQLRMTEVIESNQQQLQHLKERIQQLLITLDVASDQKLSDWLNQRLGFLAQRDTAILHTLVSDIEKKINKKF